MEYGGKNPNGINQVSQSLLSIDVQGVEQLNISTSSVDINTSLNVESGITASSFTGSFTGSFKGDGSQLESIPNTALTGDIGRIAEGSATASVLSGTSFELSVPTNIVGNVTSTGDLDIQGELSASLYKGDGGGLYNIPADALGDIGRLKSGSVEAIISPDGGLRVENFLKELWYECLLYGSNYGT